MRRFLAGTGIVALLTLAWIAVPTTDGQAQAAPRGLIVFERVRAFKSDIYVMDADGGNPRALTDTARDEHDLVARPLEHAPEVATYRSRTHDQYLQGTPDLHWARMISAGREDCNYDLR